MARRTQRRNEKRAATVDRLSHGVAVTKSFVEAHHAPLGLVMEDCWSCKLSLDLFTLSVALKESNQQQVPLLSFRGLKTEARRGRGLSAGKQAAGRSGSGRLLVRAEHWTASHLDGSARAGPDLNFCFVFETLTSFAVPEEQQQPPAIVILLIQDTQSDATSAPLNLRSPRLRGLKNSMASQADFRDRQFLAVIGDEASRVAMGWVIAVCFH